MKNIIKNTIVFVLIGLVSAASFAPVANAMGGSPAPTPVATAATGITATSAQLNGTVNPNGASTTAWFDFQSASVGSQSMGSGNSAVAMTGYTASGLTPNTTYTFRVGAINVNGSVVSNIVSFTTLSGPATPVPTLSGVAVSGVTSNSATLNGLVNPNNSPTAAWFDFNSGSYDTQNNLNGNANIPMSYNLTGLTPGTNYSFRMQAINAGGAVQSAVVNFSTLAASSGPLPVVVTLTATGITSSGAVLNGTVNPKNYPTAAWFDFNSGSYGTQNNLNGNSALPFTYALSGLSPNTTYSYRIEAINANGAVQGSIISFTTLPVNPNAPIVTTISPATSITQTSATISGIVDPNGGGSTNVQFMLNGSPVASCNQTITVPSTLNCNLTGLSVATAYTYFVTATNANGTTNGNTFSFTTLNPNGTGPGGGGGGYGPSIPSVTTNAATNISATEANLNSFVDPNGHATTHWFQWGNDSGNLSNTTSLINQGMASGGYTAKITGLTPRTTYYFRSAASNSEGTVYGATLAFVTSYSSGPNVSGLNAATTVATSVGKTTAKINGLVLNANNSANAWFEYGTSVNLGSSTTMQTIADAATTPVSETLAGLSPDTIYFYQLKAKNNAGLVFGDIKVFKTASSSANGGNGTGGATGPAQDEVSLKIDSDKQTASPDDLVNFTVSYKNIGKKDLKDVLVRVDLPKDIDFSEASDGSYSKADGVLTATVGSMASGEQGKLTLSGKVSKGAVDKDTLVTTASIVYTDSSGAQADAIDYSLVNVSAPNLLPAASIFGSGFLPSTLLGWMVLLLTVLGLVMLGRRFYSEVNWSSMAVKIGSADKKDMPPTNLPQ